MLNRPKQTTKRERRAIISAEHEKNGGLIQVSFTFGGKKHQESHRLTAGEIAEGMRVLKQHGPRALEDSTIVQVAVASGRLLGAHVITEAFKTFVRENWKEEENAPTAQDVVEEMARRRGIVLTPAQVEAVDDTAGLVQTAHVPSPDHQEIMALAEEVKEQIQEITGVNDAATKRIPTI